MTEITIPTVGQEPTYAHPGDAGADLRATSPRWINPGDALSFPLDLRIAIPEGYVGLIVGRSSLGTKHGIVLANTVGVIDSGYRGEIIVVLRNQGERPYFIGQGDRIAQLLLMPSITGVFTRVDELEESVRGEGGFGSSGK